ncbi:MAG: protein translocase subunit SecD [Verrucomicrobiota bacterium]|nr:protein translocase subunit SecD [Verrucomicrobiota bacterium]
MEKKKKWQFILILSVIALTVYNVLPTLLYYSKPLKSPITSEQAKECSQAIAHRVQHLEKDSVEWLQSYCQLLGIKPSSIQLNSDTPHLISLSFSKSEEAAKLRKYLPRAGALIEHVPSQLSVMPVSENPKEVIVQRRLSFSFAGKDPQTFFAFVPKMQDGHIAPSYRDLIQDRVDFISKTLTYSAENFLVSLKKSPHPEYLLSLASSVLDIEKLYSVRPELSQRLASRIPAAEELKELFAGLRDEIKKAKGKEGISAEDVRTLEKKELKLASAEAFLKKHAGLFVVKENARLKSNPDKVDLSKVNPFFQDMLVELNRDRLLLRFHPDIASLIQHGPQEAKQLVERLLIDEIARIAQEEQVSPSAEGYVISLQSMAGTTGFLTLKLDTIAKALAEKIAYTIRTQWHPHHPDLIDLPIVTADEFENLPIQNRALCLVIATPICDQASLSSHFQSPSLYVLAKGMDRILKTYEETKETQMGDAFSKDFRSLATLLYQYGFIGYPGAYLGDFPQDFVFEWRNYYQPLLAATREDFHVFGSKRNAVLELSDLEQRILTVNRIETQMQEELLKWKDEFLSAQVSLDPSLRYDVPAPTQSVFWNNVNLSLNKMWRGDERKVLRWGLDLSGGKTVEIELRDQNNQVVAEESNLKQGINELFNRVNKMGVSDVSIRQVGHHIVLDFPGSQAFSASDLVKASSMYFHIVNEKFSSLNPSLSDSVNRFLQEVWNEAIVTHRKDPENIHAIAYRHLYGDIAEGEAPLPQSEAARNLLENGLRLANPKTDAPHRNVDDSLSKVVVFRDQQAHAQTIPLLIVFYNHALEGAYLENVRSNYDPAKGNYLTFDVQGSALSPQGERISPRNELFAWTSQFSKEKIAGSTRELYSHGRGWRMAVLLNDTVISAPTLESALRDSASITGSFSQREVSQLVADLQAGSLSFTPHILSEKNVSPELGKEDRSKGISATFVALILVIASMIIYYRFAGFVASIAVLFNLLIMWAVLQNLGASLSLAGIAGIILTVGMAVDANVLVFERIKEEFSLHGKIGPAIHAGYEKAFSAIVDSNVTTIIAALILLNFDAGPIKAFAVTMIIGIASSMFTALFMTRFYFSGWMQNPKNKTLSMSNWIDASEIDFLKKAKTSFAIAIAIIVTGSALLYSQRASIFGMDFTGGYALHIELEGNDDLDPMASAQEALLKSGASHQDFQIRQHTPATHLRILFGTSMEQPGKPFYGLPLEITKTNAAHSYEKNPRIDWVVQSLSHAGLKLTPASLKNIESNWTAMSGQMSENMRTNALLGLLIAFISIFIYIAIRFEYKYAIAAILCLLHDVLITLGLMGILYALKVPIQIDLNTIAALMTIIGYSLNDTIIVFDRIREDANLYRMHPLRAIVNRSLNATLSRTAITSGTTLLVLLALLALGGSSIFSFALVMVIGVIFGTLSSWFIACPLMLFFHRKEEAIQTAEAR